MVVAILPLFGLRKVTMMLTRKQYLSGAVTHRQYYGQFVTEWVKTLVNGRFALLQLQKAYKKDEHFNTLPLREWDALSFAIPRTVQEQVRACGDVWSLCSGVCILKEAAQQLVEERAREYA